MSSTCKGTGLDLSLNWSLNSFSSLSRPMSKHKFWPVRRGKGKEKEKGGGGRKGREEEAGRGEGKKKGRKKEGGEGGREGGKVNRKESHPLNQQWYIHLNVKH